MCPISLPVVMIGRVACSPSVIDPHRLPNHFQNLPRRNTGTLHLDTTRFSEISVLTYDPVQLVPGNISSHDYYCFATHFSELCPLYWYQVCCDMSSSSSLFLSFALSLTRTHTHTHTHTHTYEL